MSTLIVEVCRISKIEKHPNADHLALATVKGWKTCIARDPVTGATAFVEGDKVVYIPPDTTLPLDLSDKLNATKYGAPVKDEQTGVVRGCRIKVARLRGEPSYGLVVAPENPAWPIGFSVVDHYNLSKWEPPMDCTDGDAEHDHPSFHKYFTLENIMNFPELIKDGEEVAFTEKIHGKNCRVGLIRDTKKDGTPIWRFMAGSHSVRRKEMQIQRKRRCVFDAAGMALTEKTVDEKTGEKKEKEAEWFYEITQKSQFFEALEKPGIRNLLLHLCNGQNNVVVFGEIYGSGVQDMSYGHKNGEWSFRVFDITVNGNYLNYDQKIAACTKFLVATAPLIYRGPFSQNKVAQYVSGPSELCAQEKAGAFKEREGIVITTITERTASHPGKIFQRTALKAINFAYLERKGATEYS